jgi:uncharacterized Zn-binding protein involved in type VI secretion
MGQCVVAGAMLTCSFGLAPTALVPKGSSSVVIEGRPAAQVTDMVGVTNIPTFGMCNSLANPQVAAATSAALGVLTPMPCVPAIVTPWAPGALKTMVGGVPALVSGSQCSCAYGGVVQITLPGAMRTTAG